jgi:hypothetical protein
MRPKNPKRRDRKYRKNEEGENQNLHDLEPMNDSKSKDEENTIVLPIEHVIKVANNVSAILHCLLFIAD